MVEVLLFFLICCICLYSSPLGILKVLIIILPLHLFIKNGLHFYFGGGNIFAFWKEIAVIILFLKIKSAGNLQIDRKIGILLMFYIFTVLFYFLLARNFVDALAVLRDHTVPIILFISLSCFKFNVTEFKSIFLTIIFVAFLSGIAGVVQQFFLSVEIASIKGAIDFIDSSGYVQYKTVSARIMGFERMSGLFSGPNDFGLFMSFCSVVAIYILSSKYKKIFEARELLFVQITLTLCVLCVLLSFSRAGWAVTIFSVIFLMAIGEIKVAAKTIFVGFFLFISLFFSVTLFIPRASRILEDSFSGKEASAAARGTILSRGIEKIWMEPFGHGLGTAENRSNDREFFVESAFINMTYEIGPLGVFILITLHIAVLMSLIKARSLFNYKNPFNALAFGFSASSLIAAWFSINPYGMPYIYIWWMILGLGISHLSRDNIYKQQLISDLKR